MASASAPVVQEIIGVYNADGSLRGEITYAVRRLLGNAHCALCDLTHAGLRRREGFEARRARLGVPFTLLHRDERPPDVLAISGEATPMIIVRTSAGLLPLLGADDLARCGPDPEALFEALAGRLTAHGLVLPQAEAQAG